MINSHIQHPIFCRYSKFSSITLFLHFNIFRIIFFKFFGVFQGCVVRFTLFNLFFWNKRRNILFLKQSANCFCNYFVNFPAHIVRFPWSDWFHSTHWTRSCLAYNLFKPTVSNKFSTVTKKMHESMKIFEIYNDTLESIWIIPDNFIIFLCCTKINRNMRILHV